MMSWQFADAMTRRGPFLQTGLMGAAHRYQESSSKRSELPVADQIFFPLPRHSNTLAA